METINLQDITTAVMPKGTKRKHIKDKAADMVVGLDSDKIEHFNPTTRENRILNRVYKRYNKKYQDDKFANLAREEVEKLSPKEQERWFALNKNKTAGPVLGGMAAIASLPWTLEGALVTPFATALGFGGGLLGSKIGESYGRKIDARRHNLSNASLLGNLLGGAVGGAIGGVTGNLLHTAFPKATFAYSNSPINHDFSSWRSPVEESLYGKIAQQIIHPKERAYYHGSPIKFDIQNAHMGTVNDLGLHVAQSTRIPNKMGSVVYKIYAPKPTLEMMDTWQNGINGLHGTHTLQAGMWNVSVPKNNKLMWEALDTFGKGKFVKSQRLSDAIDIKDNINIPMEQIVWKDRPTKVANKLKYLREQYDNIIHKYANSNTGRPSNGNIDEAAIVEINKQAAQVLSENGHKVASYFNANPREGLELSYIITDPKAIRLPIEQTLNKNFISTFPIWMNSNK